MSRVPRPAKSTGNIRGQYRASTTTATKATTPTTPTRLRVPSTATKPRPISPTPRKKTEDVPEPPKEKLSLKEQIALKRAEVKKAQATQKVTGPLDVGPDSLPERPRKAEDETLDLGRLGVRETIDRARSSGNLVLSSRSLPCIPSCLFEIHLGVMPKPLDSVNEPEYPADDVSKRSRQSRQQTSWFEAQDLMVLKARNNEIVAIQPELSLFGGLKVLDLHSNQLNTLPESLVSLALLTMLDVSNNNLTEFPPSLFSLPALATLNAANNQLTSLPFARFNDPVDLSGSLSPDIFYQPDVTRSTEPLPSLRVLDVGYNKLTAATIDSAHLPRNVTRIILTRNPLGESRGLISALASLERLQEIIMDHALIRDESFLEPPANGFPNLQIFDLSETEVTEEAIRSYFANSPRSNSINFHVTTAPPSPGELRISVGKRVIKESWEIEAEQRYLKKKKSAINMNTQQNDTPVEKEPWELEAEQGLMTEGGRRRARAAAAAASTSATSVARTKAVSPTQSKPRIPSPKLVEKEQWEIEAEQGLLTEGGRRRLRAQQAASSARKSSPPSTNLSLANSSYYSASTLTLTLPASVPPTRAHARAFSMAMTPQSNRKTEDLLVPTPTLPLDVISRQDFAGKLQVLNLSNRRADPSFTFPSSAVLPSMQSSGGVLPHLSELILDGCALGDVVSISYESEDGGAPTVTKRNLLEIIADTFPSLTTLDLSYNSLTSDGLSPAVIERLLVPSNDNGRKGLKILRLRGNRLTSLEAFEQVAGHFRGNREVTDWCLEELDVRDNEISRLPSLMGLIPMDVFLVDGNVFRVPPRKVWEREGTKGLLSWLRGRIE
ncbi:RNI-like protein [Fomitiporia mediterranea MF3/22]|uniref:RNI-like protein n=1 Tax=Fomitiporia mediterranea (strain MF3/22) TaxID=694068 RepID=UPI000440985E|nr:RNI-like protein [Fomitiporia mediterranea MF3/22]EJD07003.1 RNI-like protein [Fomitiporia mediterranea MF3/22]